jgi:hypothetical protein
MSALRDLPWASGSDRKASAYTVWLRTAVAYKLVK